MGTLRFADLQTRPTEVLDLTSLTVDELRQLVPPFEAAFQAQMAEWRLARPQDPTEQTRCYRGKTTCHTVKNVLLINAALTILFLSETYAGTHDKRIADATPYPLPAGSCLLQDLGFLAFTLDRVEMLMPTRKPCGRPLTRASSTSTAASNAVASSTTPAASGRRASAIL